MIKFPKIPQLQYVRPLRNNKQDYAALAECYNSFNDPESWPRGFGGSFVHTAEFIEKQYSGKDLSTQFVIEAPDDKKKLVGVCLLNRSWMLPDSWYVDLLGVSPAYQGKKLGKAALLKATEFATKKDARFLSLHTWGGNLKAMPLYKKQGYKWRPNTNVYMENYIPQILNFTLFREFFEEYCWYEIFKPIINQEIDDEKDENMLIYEYKFYHDTNNFLLVWIDRTIGKISGFHYCFRGKNLLVKLWTPSESYIAIEESILSLVVENKGDKELSVELKDIKANNIEIVEKGDYIHKLSLKPNERKMIKFRLKIPVTVPSLDLKAEPEKYSKTSIELDLSIDSIDCALTVGKLPKKTLDIVPAVTPAIIAKSAAKTQAIPLNVINFMGKDIEIMMKLSAKGSIVLVESTINTTISRYDTTVPIEILWNDNAREIEWINAEVFLTTENKKVFSKDIPIILEDLTHALVYKFDDNIFLENNHVRVIFYEDPQEHSNEVEIVDKSRNIRIYGYAPLIGYPIKEEGSEFYTKKLHFEIKEFNDGIEVRASALSDEKQGLKVTRAVFVPHAGNTVAIYYELENTDAKQTIEDVCVVFDYEHWESLPNFKYVVYPFKEGYIKRDVREIVPFLGNEPSLLKESWSAAITNDGVVGALFPIEQIEKMRYRAIPRIEQKFGNIEPLQKRESMKFWLVFTDNWHQVREKWLKEKNTPLETLLPKPFERSIVQMGIRNKGAKAKYAFNTAVLLNENDPEFEVFINSYKKAGIKGKITLYLKDAIEPKEWLIENITTDEWKALAKFPQNTGRKIVTGMFTFDTWTRIYEQPIALLSYNPKGSIKIKHNGKNDDTWVVNNGFLIFKASKKMAGRVFAISSVDEPKKNYLLTFYPDTPPFLWWAKFFGGLGGVILAKHWDDESNYKNLEFTAKSVQHGLWQGISFSSPIIDYHRDLKGLRVKATYLTLPNSPLLLFRFEVANNSEVIRQFFTRVYCYVKTSNSTDDQYYVPATGKVNKYHLYSHDAYVETDHTTNWMVFKNKELKYYLGCVHFPQNISQKLKPIAVNLQVLSLGARHEVVAIKPNETIKYEMLYVLADDVNEIAPLEHLNIEIPP